MALPLIWPEKHPDEIFRNGVDWSAVLGEASIASVGAEVVSGDVTIDKPEETAFEDAVQSVWVAGGTPGLQRVRVRANLSDGQVLEQEIRFQVTA